MTNIPLVDLGVQQRQVAEEVEAGWARVCAATAFIEGSDVRAFEEEFALFSGIGHCVGAANGTDAIELALRAAGTGYGDEVVLPANTFIATAEAVARCGARPVLADVDPDTLLSDPQLVEGVIGPRTRALLPVHLYGQMAPMARLRKLAEKFDLVVIEDAAQAQGARQDGAGVGTGSYAAATSFYPGKNLGAFGDAGAVLTGDPDAARRIRMIGSHGSDVKYQHPVLGFNSRLDTLQAVVLRAKLARLAGWNESRRRAADRYRDLLRDVPEIGLPVTAPGNEHVWHLFVVRVPRRYEVLAQLHAAGIGAGIHYPVPVHLHGAFPGLGSAGRFPVAEAAAAEILSLPLYPEISEEQQVRVATALRSAVAR